MDLFENYLILLFFIFNIYKFINKIYWKNTLAKVRNALLKYDYAIMVMRLSSLVSLWQSLGLFN